MRNARAATTILLAFGAIVPGSAQRSPSLQPPVISIVEANVINVRDGSVLPNVTIIVRNGLIESVGRNDPSADGPVIRGFGVCRYRVA